MTAVTAVASSGVGGSARAGCPGTLGRDGHLAKPLPGRLERVPCYILCVVKRRLYT